MAPTCVILVTVFLFSTNTAYGTSRDDGRRAAAVSQHFTALAQQMQTLHQTFQRLSQQQQYSPGITQALNHLGQGLKEVMTKLTRDLSEVKRKQSSRPMQGRGQQPGISTDTLGQLTGSLTKVLKELANTLAQVGDGSRTPVYERKSVEIKPPRSRLPGLPDLSREECEDGTPDCKCAPGFVRDPNNRRRCIKVETKTPQDSGHPALLLTEATSIRKIKLAGIESTTIINGTERAIAIDYYYKTGMLFWSDIEEKKIYKTPINRGTQRDVVIAKGVTQVDGLAVDWIYSHIYWTNTAADKIEVADFNGRMRKTLFNTGMDQPRAIAVCPAEGWMFWTDWGNTPRIERSGMDGQQREVIISTAITWPSGLALDLEERRVFWGDAKIYSIYSCDFNGDRRIVILHSTDYVPYPFSLTLFRDSMYWTDWVKKAILKADKATGKNPEIFVDAIEEAMTVQAFHSSRQPNSTNHCLPFNGKCSHLCLPAPQKTPSDPKVSCACPDRRRLMPDGHTCG